LSSEEYVADADLNRRFQVYQVSSAWCTVRAAHYRVWRLLFRNGLGLLASSGEHIRAALRVGLRSSRPYGRFFDGLTLEELAALPPDGRSFAGDRSARAPLIEGSSTARISPDSGLV